LQGDPNFGRSVSMGVTAVLRPVEADEASDHRITAAGRRGAERSTY
jgi:hypothetical protein